MVNLGTLSFGVVLIAGRLYGARQGYGMHAESEAIEETPTEDVGDLTAGRSEVTGTARPAADGTIAAPMTDEECLVARWEVDECVEGTRMEAGTTGQGRASAGAQAEPMWETVANGVQAVPFYLEGDTGKVLVAPDETTDFEFAHDDEQTEYVRYEEPPPDRIERFLAAAGVDRSMADDPDDPDQFDDDGLEGDRRYDQSLVQPGDDLYVLGPVHEREDGDPGADGAGMVVGSGPGPGDDAGDRFLVSTKSEEELLDERENAFLWVPIGAVMALLGIGLVVWSVL